MHVAVLFADPRGVYADFPDTELWDASRDARLYAGPWPVVAHPPCARWCMLAGLVEARYPHLRRGEDGGCFASALGSVRTYGGVLEHPAFTKAWERYGLTRPARGGWSPSGDGWVCHVDQGWYGHRSRKSTWLYAVGCELPTLEWGRGPHTASVSWCDTTHKRPRLSKREASATPKRFAEILVAMARTAYRASDVGATLDPSAYPTA